MSYATRIYYEDTDCGGIVYHANYLKFAERARSELFFARQISPEMNGYSFVVRELKIKYASSARLGDKIWANAELKMMKNASLKLYQEIRINDKDGRICAILDVEVTCIKDGKVAKIPDFFREIF